MSDREGSANGKSDGSGGVDGESPTEKAGVTLADSSISGRRLPKPEHYWRRWDSSRVAKTRSDGSVPIDDLHIHRYCNFGPLDDEGEVPAAESGDVVDDTDEPSIKYLRGRIRWGLRNTPFVVAVVAVVLLVSAELSPAVDGISVFLPSVDPLYVAAAGGGVLLWVPLLYLLFDAGLLDRSEVPKAGLVYGVFLALLVGTAGSVYLVLVAPDPTRLEPNIVYVSGYLLLLFLGGHLVYDGMLKTETLFDNLGDTFIVSPKERQEDENPPLTGLRPARSEPQQKRHAYGERLIELERDLDSRTDVRFWRSGDDDPCPVTVEAAVATDGETRSEVEEGDQSVDTDCQTARSGDIVEGVVRSNSDESADNRWYCVPTRYLFAPLFVSQFAVLWYVGRGPQNLDFSVTLAVNVLLNLFTVIVAFQFLVLIKWFYELLNAEIEVETADGTVTEPLLEYRPFHPDGRGGFRDLGKFATRVNLLLIVAGLYLVYRMYVQGARALPTETVEALGAIDPQLATGIWLVSYVGPVIAYAVAAGAWLYYSFWQMHLRMARGREEHYFADIAEDRYRSEGESLDPVGSTRDQTRWNEVRNVAPVWPIDSQRIAGLVSGSLIPLFLSVPKFLQF